MWEPTEIELALKQDLATALRKLADDIETGRMEGKFWKMQGNGMTPRYDQRAHMLVTIDLAAPLRRYQVNELFSLPEALLKANGGWIRRDEWFEGKMVRATRYFWVMSIEGQSMLHAPTPEDAEKQDWRVMEVVDATEK